MYEKISKRITCTKVLELFLLSKFCDLLFPNFIIHFSPTASEVIATLFSDDSTIAKGADLTTANDVNVDHYSH